MRAEVKITWREELVESERNFYIKLSPDVEYKLVDIESTKQAVADKLLKKLQQAAKSTKVNK